MANGVPGAFSRILANGVEVIVLPVPHTRAVSIYLASRIGSGSECAEQNGITHFVEHMLFRDRSGQPAPIAIAIERLGGQINAATELEITSVTAKVPVESWGKALRLLSEMVHAPAMDDREIEKERLVILDELAMLEDLPEEMARRALMSRLWPQHPFGREIAGSVATVQELTRDDLVGRAQHMFAGVNTVVAVAGSIDPMSGLEVLEKEFDGFVSGNSQQCPSFHGEPHETDEPILIEKEAEQAYFSIGGFVPGRRDPRRYAIDLLVAVLGAGFGSRLVQELRERRGLTYDIGADILHAGQRGVLTIEGSTDPSRLVDALAVVFAQFEDVAVAGVTDEEVERARAYVVGALVRALEDSAVVAAWYAREIVLEPEACGPTDLIDRVSAIKTEEVNLAARSIFMQGWPTLAVSGPPKEIARVSTKMQVLANGH